MSCEPRLCLLTPCSPVQAVGCDGVLGSGVVLDSCGVCGGDNSSCRVIAGVFSHPKMPYGYNMIATLPRGAANITIQQIKPSANYLGKCLASSFVFVCVHTAPSRSLSNYLCATTLNH